MGKEKRREMIWEKKKVQREKETEQGYTDKWYRAKGNPSYHAMCSLAPCHSFIRCNFT
jgi:peptide methionine sulfoxide reductase MsrB